MDNRLGQKEAPGRLQDISDLLKKPFLVRDLVDDPEGQNKIYFLINPYGFRGAEMDLYPVRDASPPGPPQ